MQMALPTRGGELAGGLLVLAGLFLVVAAIGISYRKAEEAL